MSSRRLAPLLLLGIVVFSTGCRAGSTEPFVREESRQYAIAFCKARTWMLDSGREATDPGDALETSSLPDVRRKAASRIFTIALDASERYSEDLASLSPPKGDEEFQATQLAFHTLFRDELRRVIRQVDSTTTNDELALALGEYTAWSRDHPSSADQAFQDASEELQQAIYDAPECERIFR